MKPRRQDKLRGRIGTATRSTTTLGTPNTRPSYAHKVPGDRASHQHSDIVAKPPQLHALRKTNRPMLYRVDQASPGTKASQAGTQQGCQESNQVDPKLPHTPSRERGGLLTHRTTHPHHRTTSSRSAKATWRTRRQAAKPSEPGGPAHPRQANMHSEASRGDLEPPRAPQSGRAGCPIRPRQKTELPGLHREARHGQRPSSCSKGEGPEDGNSAQQSRRATQKRDGDRQQNGTFCLHPPTAAEPGPTRSWPRYLSKTSSSPRITQGGTSSRDVEMDARVDRNRNPPVQDGLPEGMTLNPGKTATAAEEAKGNHPPPPQTSNNLQTQPAETGDITHMEGLNSKRTRNP